MVHIRTLLPGQPYRVVRAFTDYAHRPHPVGETWEVVAINFLPYADGLTLHVLVQGLPLAYRLRWRPEEQAAILDHFTDYVQVC